MQDYNIFEIDVLSKICRSLNDKPIDTIIKTLDNIGILDTVISYEFMTLCIKYNINNLLEYILDKTKDSNVLYEKSVYDKVLDYIQKYKKIDIYSTEHSPNLEFSEKDTKLFNKRMCSLYENIIEYKNITAFKILLGDSRFTMSKHDLIEFINILSKKDNETVYEFMLCFMQHPYISEDDKQICIYRIIFHDFSDVVNELIVKNYFNGNSKKFYDTIIDLLSMASIQESNKSFELLYNH